MTFRRDKKQNKKSWMLGKVSHLFTRKSKGYLIEKPWYFKNRLEKLEAQIKHIEEMKTLVERFLMGLILLVSGLFVNNKITMTALIISFGFIFLFYLINSRDYVYAVDEFTVKKEKQENEKRKVYRWRRTGIK